MSQSQNLNSFSDPAAAKWIEIIAFWVLITTLLNLFFYGLVQSSVITGSFSLPDHLDVMVNSLIGFLTWWGLRRHAPWGWKVAVVGIPGSWIYGIYSISQHYQPGMGVITALFLSIDTAIFIFLFRPAVLRMFQITARWIALAWLQYPLLVTTVFLLSIDFLGNLGGVMAAFAFFVIFSLWQRTRHEKTNGEE